jgi:polar amino acid transport system substrate-binding protein
MRRFVLAIVVLIAGLGASRADDLQRIIQAGVVRVGICLGAEPAGYRDSGGNPRGYDVEVASLMAEALGVNLDIVEVTGATRIPDLIAGRIDVIACNITATTERARRIAFSAPYLRTGIKLLVRQDAGIRGFEDIGSETRFVVGRGTTGETLVKKIAPQAQFTYVANPGEATLLMLGGEGDVYAEDSLVIDYIAKVHPTQLEALPQTHSFDAICFGIRQGNPDLLRWLDLFASIYVSSGKYAEVYDRWWGGEPPPLIAIW